VIFLAFRTLFYNDGVTTYQASDFMALADFLNTSGVKDSNALKVVANSPSDLSVKVKKGRAKVSIGSNGYIVTNDAETSVLIPANTSGYNRLDIIALKVDIQNNNTTVVDIQGIPSSAPVIPTITNAYMYLGLATIFVGNNVSVINDNVITDTRVISGPVLIGQPNGPASLNSDGHIPQSQIGISPILSVHNDIYDIDGICLFDRFFILTIQLAFVSGLTTYITNSLPARYRPKYNTTLSGFNDTDHTPISGMIWHGDASFSFWFSGGATISDAVIRCAPIIYEIRGD